VHVRDNQPTNDVMTQPISISASFTNVKWALKKPENLGIFHYITQIPVYVILFGMHRVKYKYAEVSAVTWSVDVQSSTLSLNTPSPHHL